MIGQFDHIGFITVFAGLCILADSSVSAGGKRDGLSRDDS
jgi:hypothetical protein